MHFTQVIANVEKWHTFKNTHTNKRTETKVRKLPTFVSGLNAKSSSRLVRSVTSAGP